MIPIFLLDDLKKRLEEIFKDLLFDNANKERVPLKIFKQHIPLKKADKEKMALYPCIVIKLVEGRQETWDDPQVIPVHLVVGALDDGLNRKGDGEVMSIIQKIQTDFLETPHMERQFSLTKPPDWYIYDEDVHPYYFGGVELTFKQEINIKRKDVSHLL